MEREIQEKRALRDEQAQYWAVTATVHSCCIIDQNGKEVFFSSAGFNAAPGEVSYNALTMIAKLLSTGEGTPVLPLALYDFGISLFGLKIRDRMRIMALDALRYVNQPRPGGDQPLSMPAIGLWAHHAFSNGPWCDPYDIAIPSELRSAVGWDSLAEFLSIPTPPPDFDTDVKAQAEMARQLTLRLGLVT